MPETLSLTPIDEEYLTASSMSVTSLPRGGSSKRVSATTATPQPRTCGPSSSSSSLAARETHDSDNEWEDLEEPEEEKEENEDCTQVCDGHQITNR